MHFPAGLLALLLVFAPAAFAAASAKSYQVTGPIVALTDTVITVDKDGERWEISRPPLTRIEGALVVGARVTIHYKMVAEGIAIKPSPPARPSQNASATDKADKAADAAAKRAR